MRAARRPEIILLQRVPLSSRPISSRLHLQRESPPVCAAHGPRDVPQLSTADRRARGYSLCRRKAGSGSIVSLLRARYEAIKDGKLKELNARSFA